MLLRKADRASRNIGDFVEFVIKEQVTRRPIKVTPHQRVGLDFARDHARCVRIWPAGASKTALTVGETLFMLGTDPTSRGMIVSKTQDIASKTVRVVRDYIDNSPELHLTFPKLKRSPGNAWRDDRIVVDRPEGIPDASLAAVGIGGSIQGSRLNWAIIDDILDFENTSTEEGRKKVISFILSSVISRLDPSGARLIMNNTAWHPHDAVHYLAERFASLRMTITGDIHVHDDPGRIRAGLAPWDHPLLRPKYADGEDYTCRLVREGYPDLENSIPLFPERFFFVPWELPDGTTLPPAKTMDEAIERALIDIETKRRELGPGEFNRMHMGIARDDSTAFCKEEYIETCKKAARDAKHFEMVSRYEGPNPTFTGIDLAIGLGEEHDETAFFTFEVLPDRRKKILDIEIGRWVGPEIVAKMIKKQAAYNSVCRVENNGCFSPETNVLTKRGYVPIRDVVIGDLVWTHAGRWRPVTNVLTSSSKALVHARPKGGIGVRATLNHWFEIRNGGRTSGRGGGHFVPAGAPQWVSVGLVEPLAYAHVAVPKWEPLPPVLSLLANRRATARDVEVDQEIAIFLGLWMAEGHTTPGQVVFTFARKEEYLAEFVERVSRRLVPGKATRSFGEGTCRVTISSKQLASALRPFGKSSAKCLPLEWMGWPLELRLALVRGWLVGDGCVTANNVHHASKSLVLCGSTISRNWAMFVRSTMLEVGLRPTIAAKPSRPSKFGDRVVETRHPTFVIQLNQEDGGRFSETFISEIERVRWTELPKWSGRRANACVVHDDLGAWTKLKVERGEFEPHDAEVFNLEVEEDHSFVVEDIVVHNAQEFLRQQAINLDASLPIKPHTTGRTKAHPEYGVPGGFVEMANGAWLIPNDRNGRCHPHVQKWIDGCLYYAPAKHTADAVMAWYFAREQAKQWGLLSPPPRKDGGIGRLDLF